MKRRTQYSNSHLFALILWAFSLQGHSAEFKVVEDRNGEYVYDVIYISGTIELGDDKTFYRIVSSSNKDILVSLDSTGGHLKTALEIGQLIFLRKFDTAITNIECVSACALIWLAGKTRYLHNGERLGFHSAYLIEKKTGDRRVDAVGNALIGAYIRQLELPSSVVALAVESPPDRITWVTTRNVANYGLVYTVSEDIGAHDLHNKAIIAANNNNPVRALELYREAAKRGFGGSQNNLGDMYENGEGLPRKSDPLAVYWYTRAAERGEPFAYWSLFSILSRTAPDKAGLIEALKFGLLAVEYLPDGPDREAAKKSVREARKALSRDEFQLAINAARLWEPLERSIATLSADDEV